MATRSAHAVWEGDLKSGRGTITFGYDGLEALFSYRSRFAEERPGTNPEQLIAGAHAGCFSMALVKELEAAGYWPAQVRTTAKVYLIKAEEGFEIPEIQLETEADVPHIALETLNDLAQKAKDNCIISKLLRTADIRVSAKLLSRERV